MIESSASGFGFFFSSWETQISPRWWDSLATEVMFKMPTTVTVCSREEIWQKQFFKLLFGSHELKTCFKWSHLKHTLPCDNVMWFIENVDTFRISYLQNKCYLITQWWRYLSVLPNAHRGILCCCFLTSFYYYKVVSCGAGRDKNKKNDSAPTQSLQHSEQMSLRKMLGKEEKWELREQHLHEEKTLRAWLWFCILPPALIVFHFLSLTPFLVVHDPVCILLPVFCSPLCFPQI